MTSIDDIKAKMPCPLYTLFSITNGLHCRDGVEPWFKRMTELAGGVGGCHEAVIFGMYPELEPASKEYFRCYENICSKFEIDPRKDSENLSKRLKELSLVLGEKYGLNESAEERIDPLHIVMQGLCKKLDLKDCEHVSTDFMVAEMIFVHEKENNYELMEFGMTKYPESYSVYDQVKKCLEISEIKDCSQKIDNKNYEKFVQTLGSFKYKGREYNLLDVVRPIKQKRNPLGVITEMRVDVGRTSSVLQR